MQALRFCAFAIGSIFFALQASPSGAKPSRSHRAKAEFVASHPCPAGKHRKLKCPGYIIDHIEPLCAGGKDSAANMQWQTKSDALEKDREEWRRCRDARMAIKKNKAPPLDLR